MDEVKSAPVETITSKQVKEIYVEYFRIIDSYFGSIKQYLGSDSESHIDLGNYISTYPLISNLIIDAIDDLDVEIEIFWSKNAKKLFDFIKQQNTLKCVYSGDISPVLLENFVKKTALYVDSIVIPDPIYNLTNFQKQIIFDEKYYLNKLVRHVFNVWKLKELVLADTKENIVYILPINLELINQKDRNLLHSTAESNFTGYFNKIFTLKSNSALETLKLLEDVKTNRNIYDLIKDKNNIPNIWKNFESFDDFMTRFIKTGKYTKITDKSNGWNLGVYLQGQFLRVQEHKFFCERLVAEPIYDYDLPWFFFTYEIGGMDMDGSILNALQKEKFEWIGKVPLNAIKILREENKLDYMRQTLRVGLTDLKAKNDSDLIKVSEQVEINIKNAFDQQKSEIDLLTKEINSIVKKEIPITTGGFLSGFVPYLGNVVSLFTAGRDIKKLLGQRTEANNKLTELKGNFINLLIESREE
jgi:hypothetical protein